MNDMSATYTNCPESELAGLLRADRVESRVGRFSLRSEFARRLNLGNIRSMLRGDYRRSYAVCVTVAVTSLSVSSSRRRIRNARNSLPPTH
jgi:hypothetical protein